MTHKAAAARFPVTHTHRPQMSLSQQQEAFVSIRRRLDVTAGRRDETLSFLICLVLPLTCTVYSANAMQSEYQGCDSVITVSDATLARCISNESLKLGCVLMFVLGEQRKTRNPFRTHYSNFKSTGAVPGEKRLESFTVHFLGS